jgi:hypothetical protein
MILAGYVARMGKNAYKIPVLKLEEIKTARKIILIWILKEEK